MTLALFAMASLAVLRVHLQAHEKAGTRTCSSPRPHDRPDQQHAGRNRGPYQPPIDLSVALLPCPRFAMGSGRWGKLPPRRRPPRSLPGQRGGDATRRGPDAVTTSVISPSPDLTAIVKLSCLWRASIRPEAGT